LFKKISVNNVEFILREFDIEKDSIEELTDLLHKAYKRLKDMGLNFVATYQDVESTRSHMKNGICFILTESDKIIGTIFYYLKKIKGAPDIYHKDNIVLFGKFAVDPDYQNQGLGSLLMDFIEDYARSNGKRKIILDTSEEAQHLIDYYSKRGYGYIQHWKWNMVNYRSVVMGKELKKLKKKN